MPGRRPRSRPCRRRTCRRAARFRAVVGDHRVCVGSVWQRAFARTMPNACASPQCRPCGDLLRLTYAIEKRAPGRPPPRSVGIFFVVEECLQQRCLNRTGTYVVHAKAISGVVNGHRARQLDHAPLAAQYAAERVPPTRPSSEATIRIAPAGQRRQMRSGIGSALAGGACRCPPLYGGLRRGTRRRGGAGVGALPRPASWPLGVRLARGSGQIGVRVPAGWPLVAGAGARNQWRPPGPPGPCGGDIGMVAEFLRHACGAALLAKRQDRL